MPRKVEIIAALTSESRELEELGRGVQGERELIATDDEIDDLVERCQAWFGRALTEPLRVSCRLFGLSLGLLA